MIYFVLFLASFVIYRQTNAFKNTEFCEVCIIDSSCTDDKIYFNVSISKSCQEPVNTHFTYHTDVNSKPYHYNTTSMCSNCYISISIDPVHEAWDYILTLKLPEPSKNCPSQHVAHCGGHMSQLILYIVGGLSGLTMVFGVLLCSIKYCRGYKQQVTVKKKKIEVAVINV